MKKFGSYLMFFGAFALVLSFLDRVPSLLIWIYNWGDTIAYVIMGGMTLGGAAIYFLTPKETEDVHEPVKVEVKEEVKE